MTDISPIEPQRVTAGDTIRWRKTLADYPATSGWTLKYRLINAAAKIDITAGAHGSDYVVEVAAAASATWAAGDYNWQGYVEKGTERYTVATGHMAIAPNLAAQMGGYDTRSYARRVLEAVEAALEGRASRSHLEMEVAGRRIKHMPFADLLTLRDKFRVEVRTEEAAEKMANGLDAPRKIYARL